MKFFLVCIFCLPVFVIAQNLSDGFVIKGYIKGLPENTLVYLAGVGENDTIAKSIVTKESFILTGRVNRPDGRLIVFPALNKRIFLFNGNEQITITGADENFGDLSFVGSATQSDYEEFINQIKPLGDFVAYYRQQMQTAATQGAHDSSAIMLNTAYTLYQTSIDRFIERRKTSPVSSLVLAYSYDMDPNKDVVLLERRMLSLDSTAKNNVYASGVQRVIDKGKVASVGSKATDFNLKDTSGKTVSLSQFKGKYVLLDFWASWCGPCRKENPNVVSAYHKFQNKNFTILSVSIDTEPANWLQAIKNDKLTWTHVIDVRTAESSVGVMYNVETIPQNFLIDPNGNIIAKNLRGPALENKLQEVLK